MAHITLRVIDGADRGKTYDEVETPITIGREEGNGVQLNDVRISRFHIKIQDDQGKIVLTHLESTNGTRVNGEETQLRILRYGDLISVGRAALLYGSREQIAERLETLRSGGVLPSDDSSLDKLTGSGVGALEQAGLQTFGLREYPFNAWPMFAGMERGDDGYWHLPDGAPDLPLMFALKARWP